MSKPILKDFRTVKTIKLPSYPDSEVELYDGLLFKDAALIGKLQSKPDDISIIAEVMAKAIKSWNFVDEQEQPLPVTRENVEKLKVEDVIFLANAIAQSIEEKKNS